MSWCYGGRFKFKYNQETEHHSDQQYHETDSMYKNWVSENENNTNNVNNINKIEPILWNTQLEKNLLSNYQFSLN